jgi:hypothetical protein
MAMPERFGTDLAIASLSGLSHYFCPASRFWYWSAVIKPKVWFTGKRLRFAFPGLTPFGAVNLYHKRRKYDKPMVG